MPVRALGGTLIVLASSILLHGRARESVPVQFVSKGATVHGRFFAAAGPTPLATLVLVPGWPGSQEDVLGLGALLAPEGVNVLIFNPRGFYTSEGSVTFANTLEDIGAALRWLQAPDTERRFTIDTARVALGGHSFGGGMAMAYAAGDPSVRRVISVAGNDHGEFIREYQRNPAFAEAIRGALSSTRAPRGPARFDLDESLSELAEHQNVYGLRENAGKLQDRSILLIGGWEDTQVSVDQFMLPFYRALKGAGAADVTFFVYHDGHSFSKVRRRLTSDIHEWLQRVMNR